MGPAFALDRTAVEKQIHQHRLAATDLAVNVKALDRWLVPVAACEQPTERRGFVGRTMLQYPPFERRQFLNDSELRGIAFDPAGGDGGGVTLCDGARHRDGNHEF